MIVCLAVGLPATDPKGWAVLMSFSLSSTLRLDFIKETTAALAFVLTGLLAVSAYVWFPLLVEELCLSELELPVSPG